MFMVMVRSGPVSAACAFEGTRAQCAAWVRLCRPACYRIVERR